MITGAAKATAGVVAAPEAEIAAWKRRIEALPILTRLAVVSGMRDINTGEYSDEELVATIGAADADAVIRAMHGELFAAWLASSPEQKRDAWQAHAGSHADPLQVLKTWRALKPYRLFVPAAALPEAEQSFLSDFAALLEPDAKPRALDWRVVLVRRAMEEAQGHLGLSLNDFAQRCRVSPEHLGRLFRESLGTHFRAYARALRMREAARLLADPRRHVAEVAIYLGYSTAAAFISEFKRVYGVTPRQYAAGRTAADDH